MTKLEHAALQPRGFLLSEESREKLEELRDQLFLLASFVFATTPNEEHTPLEIRRSMLGQLFEGFGLRIDEVLRPLEWIAPPLQH